MTRSARARAFPSLERPQSQRTEEPICSRRTLAFAGSSPFDGRNDGFTMRYITGLRLARRNLGAKSFAAAA